MPEERVQVWKAILSKLPGLRWLGWDVVVGFLSMALAVFVASGVLFYWGGLAESPRGGCLSIGYAMLLFLWLIVVIDLGIIALVYRAVRYRRQARGVVAVARIVLNVLMVSGVVWIVWQRPPGYVRFTEGFREGLRPAADIRGIREWQSGLTLSPGESIDPSAWPDCVKELSPRGVYVPMDGESGVKLYWGGGHMHWGLVVGPEGMETPSSSDREYVLPLCDGAYVYNH